MTPPAALLITRDELLLEDVLRLAAAAGVVLEVAHDAASAMRVWTAAGVVLVGADQAAQVSDHRPVRRDQVHVVGRPPLGSDVFRLALEMGAVDVVELPAAEAWLVELLTDTVDGGSRKAVTVGVVGGSGGAGATMLACAMAVTAATRAPSLLIDLDPLGPGVDRILGIDGANGIRWDSLMESSGRFGSRSLREALPHRDGLAVLTWAASPDQSSRRMQSEPLREVVGAGSRGNDVVIVDLPRHWDAGAEEVAGRCDHIVLVSRLTVSAVAATGRVASQARQVARSLHLVARASRSGLSTDEVSAVLGIPLLTEVSHQKRLNEHIDLGLGPLHNLRDPLGRAARIAVDRLMTARAGAA